MRFPGAFLRALLVGLACTSVLGLYEDQVGEYDWTERYIGRIAFASSRPKARADSRLIVAASEQGVIAGLRDSRVFWKTVR